MSLRSCLAASKESAVCLVKLRRRALFLVEGVVRVWSVDVAADGGRDVCVWPGVRRSGRGVW